MKRLIQAATLLIFGLLGSCATPGIAIREVDASANHIRRAVTVVMGNPRIVSSNQRSFSTLYFNRKGERLFDVEADKERFYSVITILGDRRPFDVSIEVIVEHKNNNQFVAVGTDNELAERVRKKLKEKLGQSPESLNIIDDFRAF